MVSNSIREGDDQFNLLESYVFRILINTQTPQKPVVKKPAKRVSVYPSAGKKSEDELDTAHETQVAGTCYDSIRGFYPRFHGPKEIEINGVFVTFRRLKVGQNKHVERYFSVEIEATAILSHINMVWISATVDGWRRVESLAEAPRNLRLRRYTRKTHIFHGTFHISDLLFPESLYPRVIYARRRFRLSRSPSTWNLWRLVPTFFPPPTKTMGIMSETLTAKGQLSWGFTKLSCGPKIEADLEKQLNELKITVEAKWRETDGETVLL